ncbi:MAG: ribulose-phosphate 3-epimerase [Armatimonadetes bacterium]|nr:ribulose-phosphate 3-epimerase [Armatimonadota bacterium]
MSPLQVHVGIKTDPIQYRYSYGWLFRLLAEEGVQRVQLGTFPEIYLLPDDWFRTLRAEAEELGLTIGSVFTAHRELGGFFREEAGWPETARRSFERLIEVAALVGASAVGSNPGAIVRDRMHHKAPGIACYLRHMRDLLRRCKDAGVDWLTMEPMSCLAEPPTLPGEIADMMENLLEAHHADPGGTARPGLCADVSHGYADASRNVVHGHMELLQACMPYVCELHLKNTDAVYNSTFGFSADERSRGVVDLAEVRDLLQASDAGLPRRDLTAYLEIGGPKTGRDYTDCGVEEALRISLRHCLEVFPPEPDSAPSSVGAPLAVSASLASRPVLVAPSMMCADQLNLGGAIAELEAAGADWLHYDIMDSRFTPNLPMGLVQIEQARKATTLPFDVHLMVCDNDLLVEKLAPLGVQSVSVHVESCVHLHRTLALIRGHGMAAGAALNPATPLSALEHVAGDLDFVVVMTVNPGFAGQPLVPSCLRKIADCRAMLDRHGSKALIQVDGNVSLQHIPAMVAMGADVLVAGTSSLFRSGASIGANMRATRRAIADGLGQRAWDGPA